MLLNLTFVEPLIQFHVEILQELLHPREGSRPFQLRLLQLLGLPMRRGLPRFLRLRRLELQALPLPRGLHDPRERWPWCVLRR